jgi:hypothetical protein
MPLLDLDALVRDATNAGMRVTQRAITRRWLTENATRFDRVEFEVRVGEGTPPLSTFTDEQRADHKRQTQMRIDAVAWDRQYPTLVEVKKRLDTNAIGQLLTYRLLFMQANPNSPEPQMVAIGERADPDVVTSANAHGIDVEVYPVADA